MAEVAEVPAAKQASSEAPQAETLKAEMSQTKPSVAEAPEPKQPASKVEKEVAKLANEPVTTRKQEPRELPATSKNSETDLASTTAPSKPESYTRPVNDPRISAKQVTAEVRSVKAEVNVSQPLNTDRASDVTITPRDLSRPANDPRNRLAAETAATEKTDESQTV